MSAKYIFVTGGVVSSLGKGLKTIHVPTKQITLCHIR